VVPRAQRPVLNAAVLGQPVAHSLSPALHRAGFRALGLHDWSYAAHELSAVELASWVAGLDDSWRGLSLTMPLKEVAFDVAASVSATARAAGAVNTLVRREDLGWDAHNTDVTGLVRTLAEVDHGGRAMLLGSGATARSAALALAELGVRDVVVAARNGAAAQDVVDVLSRHDVAGRRVPLAEWASQPCRLVVSTLPPAAGAVAADALREVTRTSTEVTLLDVVYADWPTPLARAGELAGMTVLSGLELLVQQAAEQFRLFTGRTAPLEDMFAAGREALRR
jgi:shikimate dehydrogenase